ncbi:autotransporter domain-containing protein [Erythrobacter sp. Alg231-14]|uniref:autotransporter domain-containing protein n=1 Tax=Erythrobacter sp. Alg231-14 TaxID=1922225 RepID=UPI000D557650
MIHSIARKAALNTGRFLVTSSTVALLATGAANAQQVINDGDTMTVTSNADGDTITAGVDVTSVVDGAPVVVVANNDVTVDNAGTLATTGVTQTVQVNQGVTGATINNAETGRLEGASRVVNFDGTDAVLNNAGVILGTASQRNGAVYANRTSNTITINNAATGSIDAGVEGAGIAIEVGGGGMARDGAITNAGTIQGRGQASAAGGTAGDGIRFFGPGLAPEYIYSGDITNSGVINSESAQGTVAGIRFANRIGFQGTLTNEADGTISGAQNGLYFGNDADHTGGVVNNLGTIASDSRALNIDGLGLVVNNSGSIIGTGNQRNGTVYADSTAQSFELNNLEGGLIDAGMGNEGAGFSVELSEAGNDFSITNAGTIQGRGQAGAGDPTAGDGLRFERTRVGGLLEGSTTGLFTGSIDNSGLIASEAVAGTTGGIRFVNGVSFQGVLNNSGTISGVNNGLYFGNPVPAGGADHTGGVVNNLADGVISSDSRALNIDGTGLVVNNAGTILGTGNQRNGTVYSDITAQGFALNNDGVIDAGMGNEGAGFSAQLASAATGGSAFTLTNTGTIQGRGNALAGAATAGDGLRFERTRNAGVLDATSDGLFVGTITNSGVIASESANGTAGGIRFVNGVSFQGVLDNSGTISGVQNGLYFGNPTPAGGGDFSQAIVNNSGTISSGSRALNIDGNGLTVNNTGSILGTGAQRNGTVYADGTANNFVLNNAGIIDAGVAGSGVSLQLGVNDGDLRAFTLVNDGTIAGRGEAQASGASAGLRLFNGAGEGTTVTVADDIVNNGTISSETAAAVLIENVAFTGTFTNNGTLSGVNAVDASTALAGLNFVQNGGALNGAFVGSAFADTLTFASGNSTLSDGVSGGVDVTIADMATLTVSGAQTIDGSLNANGTLNFDLGVDSLAVVGDTALGMSSVINVATTQIGQADIGSTIDVLTETGAFTDNGVTVNVIEDDFLVDYTVNLGSVSVAVSATDLSNVSSDSNINSFGSAIASAAANNRLSDDVFAALNGVTSATGFEANALTLLPAINDGVTREIYESQRLASAQVQDRLSGDGVGLWGAAFARTADADPTSVSGLGYDADATGFTLGLDGKVGEAATVGILFNYSDIEVEANVAAAAESNIDAIQIGGYAGFDLGQAYVNAELGYSSSSVDNSRVALNAPVSGESDVDGVYASLNAGYDIDAGGVVITPNGGLRYAELSRDTFTETGGLGLTLDSDSAEFLEARIGLRVAGGNDSGLIPYASVDYAYDLSSDPLAIAGSFNGGADTFTVVADEASESRFDVGAGIDFVNEGGLSIGAEYRGRFASEYQSHSGGLRVRFAF